MTGPAQAAEMWWPLALLLVAAAAALSAGLIVVLLPALRRHALAKPNARSSHVEPTPQGGGIAVVVATVIVALAAVTLTSPPGERAQLAWVLGAAALIAAVGAVDDMRAMPVLPRLLLQALAVAVVIAALPAELRVVPPLPWWIERALLALAALWFVNLVNFMDGIDWMTVAETVPIAGGLVAAGWLGALPSAGVVAALALLGAVLGFAPFNRPVARLFFGDVGSLPIGVLLAWLLILLAGSGHVAAALLLPLYYLADATLTLARRLFAGERVWQAHRTHFYQRATDGGFAVIEIVRRVFVVNIVLAALALVTVMISDRWVAVATLAAGAALVAWLLRAFARGKPR
ncbi:MAG TPA: glycosyl transferase [Xanthobacteraceae bacterium]|jgi:UDP-N-acetylmuramyl pentapeptide phosphotransferase/UDP-N-acetylglucosamine-1-phosphate transferase|nr:glycosyl transferase [Xanthobacteraceae bacterium]